tara:strand:- start:2996 stop:3310 length:315 start_codon:yes stop_codon:yes gene_type:complete
MKKNIHTLSLLRSSVGTIAFIVLITLWSELSGQFKGFLADITGHHWVTKGVASLLFFAVLYIILSKISRDSTEPKDIQKGVYYVIASVVVGGIIIFAFYIWHFL